MYCTQYALFVCIERLSLAMQLELIRLITSDKPLVAAVKVSEKITEVIKSPMLVHLPRRVIFCDLIYFFFYVKSLNSYSTDSYILVSSHAKIFLSQLLLDIGMQDLAMIESMHLALENVVSSIFDVSNEYGKNITEVQPLLHRTLEGLVTVASIYLKLLFRSLPSADLNNIT